MPSPPVLEGRVPPASSCPFCAASPSSEMGVQPLSVWEGSAGRPKVKGDGIPAVCAEAACALLCAFAEHRSDACAWEVAGLPPAVSILYLQ